MVCGRSDCTISGASRSLADVAVYRLFHIDPTSIIGRSLMTSASDEACHFWISWISPLTGGKSAFSMPLLGSTSRSHSSQLACEGLSGTG